LVAGVSGVDVISNFDASEYPVNIAAQVKDFDPTLAMSVKEARKTGPNVHFGVGAAMEAGRDSGLEDIDPSRAGVIIGSAVGGLPQVLDEQKVLEERGRERVSPHWLPNMLVDTTTSHVATQLGIRGVNYAIVSACARGSHAISDSALRGRAGARPRLAGEGRRGAGGAPGAGRRDPGRRNRVGNRAADPGRVLLDA